jgi:hypothetical protein
MADMAQEEGWAVEWWGTLHHTIVSKTNLMSPSVIFAFLIPLGFILWGYSIPLSAAGNLAEEPEEEKITSDTKAAKKGSKKASE